jgi:dienelactone hydrolase
MKCFVAFFLLQSPTLGAAAGAIGKKGVTIGGLHCDKIQTGSVFYPSDTSKKYPLLSFAHGWTEGGGFTDGNYKNVLEAVAASGYVVVAHHSGLFTECQSIYPGDQLRALSYINETAEWSSMVDWNSKHGIYGHSMGGGATGDNAGRQNAIDKYNLGAAVLLHPVATRTRTKIPTFYATGSADVICFPGGCESWSKTASKPYIFAEMAGATHFECQSSEDGLPCPAGWTNYVINWFNCHLKGMKDQCDAAFSVCTSPTKRMTKTSCQPGGNDDAMPGSGGNGTYTMV